MMHKAWCSIEEVPCLFCFLLFFWRVRGGGGVIHQISSSHGLKNWRFESNLNKITRPVAAIKSLRVALFIKITNVFLFVTAACLIVCVTIFMPEIQKRKYTGHQSTIKMGYSGALLCVSAVLSVAGAAVAIADLIVGESSSESTPYPPSPHPFVVNKVQGYSRDVEWTCD